MPAPAGGFYLFPNFDNYDELLRARGIHTSYDLCRCLLGEVGIALLPGSVFGRPENELITRLAFVDFDGDTLLRKIEQEGRHDDFSTKFENYFPNIFTGIERLKGWLSNL